MKNKTGLSIWEQILLALIVLDAAYSFFQHYHFPLDGLGSICTMKLGLPMLLGAICFNLFLIKKRGMPSTEGTVFFRAKQALFFMTAYLLLLPFGYFRIEIKPEIAPALGIGN